MTWLSIYVTCAGIGNEICEMACLRGITNFTLLTGENNLLKKNSIELSGCSFNELPLF